VYSKEFLFTDFYVAPIEDGPVSKRGECGGGINCSLTVLSDKMYEYYMHACTCTHTHTTVDDSESTNRKQY